MSAKWRRNKAWDHANLAGPFLPVKWLLWTFSSITLAVILLIFIALYGALASVPIGLFALIPTFLFYGLTLAVTIGLIAGLPMWFARKPIRRFEKPGQRFLARFLGGGILVLLAMVIWRETIWPAVYYVGGPDPIGIRFFGDFVDANSGRLLRQLPAFEMTELEFYAWWPFRIALILFVVNMIVATIRRIEFRWLNIGVLTVHTGIVLIALGSVFYKSAKVEGSMVLFASQRWPKATFYDNIATAIYLQQGERSLMVRIAGLPRYNNAPANTAHAPNLRIHEIPEFQEVFPAELEVSVVGVIPYGEMVQEDWNDSGDQISPSVEVALVTDQPIDGHREYLRERLVGLIPAQGTARVADIMAIQHLVSPSHQRVEDLAAEFPANGDHLLVVRIPKAQHEQKLAVEVGEKIDVGETGWSFEVAEHQKPGEGLALMTEGYRGAQSSRLRLKVTRPDGTTFTRSVISRYPEITQDFTIVPGQAQPNRTPPDPAFDVTYIDTTMTNFIVIQPDPTNAQFEVIRRAPGGAVMRWSIAEGERISAGEIMGTPLFLEVGEFLSHTAPNVVVRPVPENRQDRDRRGTYAEAFLDVEVMARDSSGSPWTRRVWLPFNQYLDPETGPVTRTLDVPGVGDMQLAFGRLQRRLPGVALALEEFEMIPYPGTETPRDFVSKLRVFNESTDMHGETHVTRLNRPYIYRVPFERREDQSFVTNAIARAFRLVVPDQYKFSQAGWDPQGQRYTVLGVGNNSGIYIIAIGALLIAVGIPLAFYAKPAILRYHKRRIQRELEVQNISAATNTSKNGRAVPETSDEIAAGGRS